MVSQGRLRLYSSLLLGDEQTVDILAGQPLMAVVGVDGQERAAGGQPDDEVAELENVLDLGVTFQDEEVGVAHGLDGDGGQLGIVTLVNPDAADFHELAAADGARRCQSEPALLAQYLRLLRQIDAELASLGLLLLA